VFPQTFQPGTPIILDPANAMYSAIGAGNLRACVQGQDGAGHAAGSARREGSAAHWHPQVARTPLSAVLGLFQAPG
jgi:hypothetical protein